MQEPAELNRPVVVDLGKQKRKRVKQLKQGRGPLVADVDATIAEVRRQMGATAGAKEFVPVVVVFERKQKKRGAKMPLPFFPFKML
jgi:hypothetical protein